MLGFAAAQRMRHDQSDVIVTAPLRSCVVSVFRHAAACLGLEESNQATLTTPEGSRLRFLPLDRVIQDRPQADLLLVDEAAALPPYRLHQLARHYHRLIFATTIHGYEGSGRGFDLRFWPVLVQQYPKARRLHLTQPVRWSASDPLEAWTFSALLLRADWPDEPSIGQLSQQSTERVACQVIRCERISQAQLAQNEILLQSVFGLLVVAHYRTTPTDLQNLLDAPGLDLWVAWQGEHLVGVLLAAREEALPEELA
jgi:tRNA(Met) cytidine acetyltransferase